MKVFLPIILAAALVIPLQWLAYDCGETTGTGWVLAGQFDESKLYDNYLCPGDMVVYREGYLDLRPLFHYKDKDGWDYWEGYFYPLFPDLMVEGHVYEYFHDPAEHCGPIQYIQPHPFKLDCRPIKP